MTESEARRSVCPLTFQSGQAQNCLASTCMAWRWNTAVSPNGGTIGISDEHGHCGLAATDVIQPGSPRSVP